MSSTRTTKRDRRYTVRLERTGRSRGQYVARFCGAWVGSADTAQQAWAQADDYEASRLRWLSALSSKSINQMRQEHHV